LYLELIWAREANLGLSLENVFRVRVSDSDFVTPTLILPIAGYDLERKTMGGFQSHPELEGISRRDAARFR
jgi:hypothetical protein